jgi:hypothetical protein
LMRWRWSCCASFTGPETPSASIRQTDDCRERRAKLVAHRREKVGFRLFAASAAR